MLDVDATRGSKMVDPPRTRAAGSLVIGLDGCPTGWVAVVLRDGRVDGVRVVTSIRDVLDEVGAEHVGIDMPVGLVDGPRETDAAARGLLPGRASSVFSTAARSVVEGYVAGTVTTHAEATACNVAVTGSGLSQQAWRLVPKMAEVEGLASSGIVLTEVHPELAFATIVGEPLPRKRSWPGLMRRREVLADLGIDLPTRFDGDTAAAPDDVVDAAVCAWVADGLACGAPMLRVPERTDQVAHGRAIVITVRKA